VFKPRKICYYGSIYIKLEKSNKISTSIKNDKRKLVFLKDFNLIRLKNGKTKKYHTIRTVPKTNRKMDETNAK